LSTVHKIALISLIKGTDMNIKKIKYILLRFLFRLNNSNNIVSFYFILFYFFTSNNLITSFTLFYFIINYSFFLKRQNLLPCIYFHSFNFFFIFLTKNLEYIYNKNKGIYININKYKNNKKNMKVTCQA